MLISRARYLLRSSRPLRFESSIDGQSFGHTRLLQLLGNRSYSAAPVQQLTELEEELHDREDRASAERAAHQRLVYEMFKIQQAVQHKKKHTRRNREAVLYHAPLAVVLEGLRKDGGGSGGEQHVLDLWQRQIAQEQSVLMDAVREYDEQSARCKARRSFADLGPSQRVQLQWYQPLVAAIEAEQKAIIQASKDVPVGRFKYAPYLLQLDAKRLAVITLHSALNWLLSGERIVSHEPVQAGIAKATSVAGAIGKAVLAEVSWDEMKAKLAHDNRRRNALLSTFRSAEPRGALAPEAAMAGMVEASQALNPNLAREVVKAGRLWFEEGHGVEERLMELLKRWAPTKKVKPTAVRRALSTKNHLDWSEPNRLKIGFALMHQLINTCEIDVPYAPHSAPEAARAAESETSVGSNLGFYLGGDEAAAAIELGADGRDAGLEAVRAGRGAGKMLAFKHLVGYTKGDRRLGLLRCHEEVLRQFGNAHQLAVLPRYMPMLVPPVPWRTCMSGGYLLKRALVMRTRVPRSAGHLLRAADEQQPGGLSQVYAALNALGETPWIINTRVLDALRAAYALGGGLGGLPSVADRPLLPKPNFCRFRPERVNNRQLAVMISRDATRSEAYQRKLANGKARKFNREQYALQASFNYKMQVAEKFKDEEAIYFPHNVDFRGRAYPMHPNLNHLGDDVCRGLLMFANARPLGPTGLGWLYVQAASNWGHGIDKLPMGSRQQWVQSQLELILDAAERPFEGHRWWLGAEAPWQMLAACLEIRDALASGDPASFRSHLPVQMDGSCNGLQHYAALGRDASGGRAVNLTPTDRPQDVYSGIADLVRARMATDAAADGKDAGVAGAMVGAVDRKLVKQTVMTSVYGVTHVGAREQINSRLRERKFSPAPGPNGPVSIFHATNYSAKVTISSMGELFADARRIMHWLAECAARVAAQGHSVSWRTPLGLPVLQPYREQKIQQIQTVVQRFLILRDDEAAPVKKARQRSAFPPNYIHSLDSTHMMMTAIACRDAGLSFAGVHDSFWTHAADLPTLNRILREQFVALHSQPLLHQLRDQLLEAYPDAELPKVPAHGDLDLTQVLESEYFFS